MTIELLQQTDRSAAQTPPQSRRHLDPAMAWLAWQDAATAMPARLAEGVGRGVLGPSWPFRPMRYKTGVSCAGL